MKGRWRGVPEIAGPAWTAEV